MKKQLLFVINHLTVGGIQKTLISALKVLDYDKYDVTVYLRKNRTDLLPLIDKRANIIINKDPNKYYRKPKALILQALVEFNKLIGSKKKAEELQKKLVALINSYCMNYERKTYFKDKKYDIAIAYANGYPAYFVADYIEADEKIIFFHTSTNDLPEIHIKFITKFDKAVAVQDGLVSLISEWYPCLSDKIRVVENFVDADALRQQSLETKIETPENKTVLCSCGRFAPVKGFDMAVEAAKQLKSNGVDFIWYFVGDGPERNNIENKISENGLENNIIITGMKQNPYPYMAACDIYVQPSYEEAMPVTIIESIRLNKPIVSTATAGGKKLVKHHKNGLICEINPQSLVNNIHELINDKELFYNTKHTLESADYSHEAKKYKEQWKALLEE